MRLHTNRTELRASSYITLDTTLPLSSLPRLEGIGLEVKKKEEENVFPSS